MQLNRATKLYADAGSSLSRPPGGAAGPETEKDLPAYATLRESQIHHFSELGWLSIKEPLISYPELRKIRDSLEDLLERRAGWAEGAQYDLVGSNIDKKAGQEISQISNPSDFAPQLRRTEYRTTALAIARQLLGPQAYLSGEHAIIKPPGCEKETPWHQDEAYRIDPNFEFKGISIWLALQDVNLENGCMQYVSQRPDKTVLPHRPISNDPLIHAIVCCGDFDPSLAHVCPLPAGGATVHGGLTLHSSGPNRSAHARYAYVLGFELPPKAVAHPLQHPWHVGSKALNRRRRKAWILRGGFFVLLLRKLRYSGANKSALLARYLVRAWRSLLQL